MAPCCRVIDGKSLLIIVRFLSSISLAPLLETSMPVELPTSSLFSPLYLQPQRSPSCRRAGRDIYTFITEVDFVALYGKVSDFSLPICRSADIHPTIYGVILDGCCLQSRTLTGCRLCQDIYVAEEFIISNNSIFHCMVVDPHFQGSAGSNLVLFTSSRRCWSRHTGTAGVDYIVAYRPT